MKLLLLSIFFSTIVPSLAEGPAAECGNEYVLVGEQHDEVVPQCDQFGCPEVDSCDSCKLICDDDSLCEAYECNALGDKFSCSFNGHLTTTDDCGPLCQSQTVCVKNSTQVDGINFVAPTSINRRKLWPLSGGPVNPTCNSGYEDQTDGNAYWWACGHHCPGGTYWSDINCNCACGEKEPEPEPISEMCMDAYTANNGQYNTIFEQPLGSSKAITFTVRANNDAHVGFFSNSKSLSEVYEIVIGGWGNSWSVIRESNQGANQVAQATSQIVSGSEDRDFWASAENGLVQFGLGHKIGEQVVLAWQDPNPHEAMYVGVMTGWGADGVWDVCLDDPEPKTCSAHSDCPSKLPFCYEGFCADCSECHFCHDGIDGTCGTCGEGFPTKEQGSCGNSGPKICLDASTANNGQYNTIFEQPLGSSKSITFTVQANNDAHVGFFSSSKSLSEVYEIVIGGWGNSMSVIRESNQGANQVSEATSQIVSGGEAREFWASAENGLVQLGRGSIVGEQIVLSWQDPNPHEAMYVGVMTGWGATGIWNVCLDGEDSTSEYTTHAYSQCWVNNVQHSGDREDNPIFNGGGFIGSYTGAECARFCDDMSNTDQHGRTCVAFEHSSQDYNAVASCALAWGCDHTEHWSGGKTYIRSSETCMDASTANNGQYNTIFDQPLGSSKSITFTVRANNDAHVGFFSSSKSLSEVYEIVIGGWANSWSVIRESNQGANQVSAPTSQIVSGNEDREFWASADNGLVQFGRGNIVGQEVVLSWQDPNPHEVVYVGVMTGWGAEGDWNVCMNANPGRRSLSYKGRNSKEIGGRKI